MAITVAPLTTTVMTSIDDERHAGAASGINNTVARAAGLLAIALFGALAVMIFARDMAGRLSPKEAAKLAAATPPPGVERRVIDDAFIHAFRINMLVAAALAMASSAGALVIATGRPPAGGPGPQRLSSRKSRFVRESRVQARPTSAAGRARPPEASRRLTGSSPRRSGPSRSGLASPLEAPSASL